MPATNEKWRFWIDRGGTFTDIVARRPDGRIEARKLLSEAPHRYEDAALAGIREFLGLEKSEPIPAGRIAAIKMGTTVATNALLERKGEPTLLVITKGLEDQLEIGTQARPAIFARRIVKPEMLYRAVVGADERVRADGTIERPLDLARLESDLAAARRRGLECVAIVFMHAYAYPEHERQAAALARALGFTQVSVSHEVSPLIKIVGRGDTTVADAYLSPVLRRYIDRVSTALTSPSPPSPSNGEGAYPEHGLQFMASSGGLKSAHLFHGRDAILSGPAGGVVGMAETARAAGFSRVIGFDMGGTSTDVSHFAGVYERSFETEVAGVRLRVPMLSIHTVAAGGGSILSYDGMRFRAGPESAGSSPGPMCYRRGGPLTVTDANVMVGKLKPEFFPAIFGPDVRDSIDPAPVTEAFRDIASRLGDGRAAEAVADGFIRIAVESMANAIKRISVERGYDVTRYALSCFGSAGGQHACLIADTLGMATILIHPLSGLLSAYGIGLAHVRASRELSIEAPLAAETMRTIEDGAWRLGNDATEELLDQGVEHDDIAITSTLHLRYEGTDTALPVALSEPGPMRRDFAAAHLRRFGFISPEKRIFVAHLEVEAQGGGEASTFPPTRAEGSTGGGKGGEEPPISGAELTTRFFSREAWHEAPILTRASFTPGVTRTGPALIIEPHQTVVVEPGWSAALTLRNDLVLTRAKGACTAANATAPMNLGSPHAKPDPVLLEVFNHLFTGIAEQMGEALRNTAQSVNIKERLDFSCALFDACGDLIANAPHVPVHLGSMDASVKSVIRAKRDAMQPGDVFMLNAPYGGGTHLPDITVVTPVFDAEAMRILFYVASRGHHADVGGIAPGSMSPNARTIDEEGVYIDCAVLVDNGRFQEAEVHALLTTAKYPARNPAQNIADLKAQVAANARGSAELQKLIAEFGLDVVEAYMAHVQDNAEEAVRRLIGKLQDGRFRVESDDGWAVEVAITIDRERRSARVDFAGTSPQQPTNVNAPEPVTRAAVLYAFRVLVDEPIPMNAGCLRPLEIVIPEGSLLKPRYPAAVAAGNVETSQVVTNALFAALGALSSSQGTMNNLTFGDARVQYYETICSGAPAGFDKHGNGFDGAAAVQVHMTNTRLTDPEILEQRYPVLLEEFSIRRGSGGKGRWSSGDGVRRVIRFLAPMTCAILSGYRKLRPFGLLGGEAGRLGENSVRRRNGRTERLPGSAETHLEPGDAVVIVTPTGGGLGPLPPERQAIHDGQIDVAG
ncbi:MAG: hydantoinase B/oxoprolinase family protein [Hyphomicrobium sp.]|jgi:5-oxoprolinase (ATP-hydrolysing)